MAFKISLASPKSPSWLKSNSSTGVVAGVFLENVSRKGVWARWESTHIRVNSHMALKRTKHPTIKRSVVMLKVVFAGVSKGLVRVFLYYLIAELAVTQDTLFFSSFPKWAEDLLFRRN